MNRKQAAILALLAREDTPRGMDEFEISDGIGAGLGTLYAHIKELQDFGLVEARWQNENRWPLTGRPAPGEATKPKEPRMRYYRITPQGHDERGKHIPEPSRRRVFGLRRRPRPA